MTGSELKPCPFCGDWGAECAESAVPSIHGGQKQAVYCNSCFCEGPTSEAQQGAVDAWNARSPVGPVWRPIMGAPQDGTRLMLWDSVSKRPVFGGWRGDNPAITHYAAEPAGPEVT